MVEAIATATEIQNNFGKYLKMILNGNQVIITKNGKEVGRLVPKEDTEEYLTDALTGVLRTAPKMDDPKESRLKERYDLTD